jgi:hypothetical protein
MDATTIIVVLVLTAAAVLLIGTAAIKSSKNASAEGRTPTTETVTPGATGEHTANNPPEPTRGRKTQVK